MSFGAEIVELSEMFFKDEVEYEEEGQEVLAGEQVPEVMAAFKDQLEALEAFEARLQLKRQLKQFKRKQVIKGKTYLCQSVLLTTGQTHGPELPNAIALIGKEKVISIVFEK